MDSITVAIPGLIYRGRVSSQINFYFEEGCVKYRGLFCVEKAVEIYKHSNGQMEHVFSPEKMNLSSYLSSLVALGGFWLLTYNIFEFVKIAYPSKTGWHEFLSFCFPFLILFLLSRILLPQLKVLKKQKLILIFYAAVGIYCLSKAQVASIVALFSSSQLLYTAQFLLDVFPIVLFIFLVAYGCQGRHGQVEKKPSKYFLLLAVIFLFISQMIGFAKDVHYLTQDDLVRGDLIRDELVGGLAAPLSLKKQMAVANSFSIGIGTTKDSEQALHWYEQAFAHGAPDAAYYIGKHYDDLGETSRASEWYAKAADRGNDWAKYALRKFIIEQVPDIENPGVEISVCGNKKHFDVEKCRELALKGYGKAQYQYAQYLKRTYKQDARFPLMNVSFWYEQAAASGARGAAHQIGKLYEEGTYHRPDFNKAEKWYSLAIQQGDIWHIPHAKILMWINQIRGVK